MDAGLVGRILLYAAIATSVWGAAASLLGKHRADARLAVSGRRGLYATSGLLVAATLWLVAALLRHDFSILYVAQVTSRSTPFPYPLTALWAGMAGSLLFWTLLTSLYASSAIAVQAPRRPELVAVATAVASAILAFFAVILAFGANAFVSSSPIPLDGQGLNPLLQSPVMSI